MLAALVLLLGAAPAQASAKDQAQARANSARQRLDAATEAVQAARNDLEAVQEQLDAAQRQAEEQRRHMEQARLVLARQAASLYRGAGGAGVINQVLSGEGDFARRMEFAGLVADRQNQTLADARDAAGIYEATVAQLRKGAERKRVLLRDLRDRNATLAKDFEAAKDALVPDLPPTNPTNPGNSGAGDDVGSGGSGPARGGTASPVGQPRSYIDSWGFARSGGRRHQGTDIMAPRGTPAYAPMDGVITRTKPNNLGGIVYHMRGVDGTEFYGAHLSKLLAHSGQKVRAGQLVGLVGNTGDARTTAPHLHFERHPGGGPAVNPYAWVVRACG